MGCDTDIEDIGVVDHCEIIREAAAPERKASDDNIRGHTMAALHHAMRDAFETNLHIRNPHEDQMSRQAARAGSPQGPQTATRC